MCRYQTCTQFVCVNACQDGQTARHIDLRGYACIYVAELAASYRNKKVHTGIACLCVRGYEVVHGACSV